MKIRSRGAARLSFVCLASVLSGADCEVGRQVVDRRSRPEGEFICASRPCDPLQNVRFELPNFASPGVCPEASCAPTPIEGVASNSGVSMAHVSFHADSPREIDLRGVALTNVLLDLAGPASLRLTNESSLEFVYVVMRATEQGTPRLILEESQLHSVSFGDLGAGRAAGRVELLRCTSGSTSFAVDELAMRSSEAEGARFDIRSFEAVDSALLRSEASFEDAYFSKVAATSLRTRDCGQLDAAGVTFEGDATEIGPCTFMRLQRASITNGMLDGPIHGEVLTAQSVRVGSRAPTNLDLWQSTLNNSLLCPQTGLLRMDPLSSVRCTSCEGAPATAGCLLSEEPSDLDFSNPCEPLQAEALLPCAQPWPEATYPR